MEAQGSHLLEGGPVLPSEEAGVPLLWHPLTSTVFNPKRLLRATHTHTHQLQSLLWSEGGLSHCALGSPHGSPRNAPWACPAPRCSLSMGGQTWRGPELEGLRAPFHRQGPRVTPGCPEAGGFRVLGAFGCCSALSSDPLSPSPRAGSRVGWEVGTVAVLGGAQPTRLLGVGRRTRGVWPGCDSQLSLISPILCLSTGPPASSRSDS